MIWEKMLPDPPLLTKQRCNTKYSWYCRLLETLGMTSIIMARLKIELK